MHFLSFHIFYYFSFPVQGIIYSAIVIFKFFIIYVLSTRGCWEGASASSIVVCEAIASMLTLLVQYRLLWPQGVGGVGLGMAGIPVIYYERYDCPCQTFTPPLALYAIMLRIPLVQGHPHPTTPSLLALKFYQRH